MSIGVFGWWAVGSFLQALRSKNYFLCQIPTIFEFKVFKAIARNLLSIQNENQFVWLVSGGQLLVLNASKSNQFSIFSGHKKQEDWNIGGPTTPKFVGGPA